MGSKTAVTHNWCDAQLVWRTTGVTHNWCDAHLLWRTTGVTHNWCDVQLMWRTTDVTHIHIPKSSAAQHNNDGESVLSLRTCVQNRCHKSLGLLITHRRGESFTILAVGLIDWRDWFCALLLRGGRQRPLLDRVTLSLLARRVLQSWNFTKKQKNFNFGSIVLGRLDLCLLWSFGWIRLVLTCGGVFEATSALKKRRFKTPLQIGPLTRGVTAGVWLTGQCWMILCQLRTQNGSVVLHYALPF